MNKIKQGGFYINHKKISYGQKFPEITGLFIDNNASLTVNSTIKERAKGNPFTMQYLERVRSSSRNKKVISS